VVGDRDQAFDLGFDRAPEPGHVGVQAGAAARSGRLDAPACVLFDLAILDGGADLQCTGPLAVRDVPVRPACRALSGDHHGRGGGDGEGVSDENGREGMTLPTVRRLA
jgi:hypothetical protein